MQYLFLDESGDHNLQLIDPQYPLFVLGGVIVDGAYAEGELVMRLNDFKREMFGREDLILHTADLTRNRNGFERLKDHAFRQVFYEGLNKLMDNLQYMERKLRRSPAGKVDGFGLVVLPRQVSVPKKKEPTPATQ